MADRFTYLVLDLGILAALGLLVYRRRDLWRMCLKLGIIGGLAGFAGEIFYFRDYWRPPSSMGIAILSPEDFLFGAGIIALAAVLYPALAGYQLSRGTAKRRLRQLYILFALGTATLLIGTLLLEINSILVTSAYFIFALVVMLWQRRDLIPAATFATLTGVGFITAWYALLFDKLSPHFWQQHWLLYHTHLGGMILGNIPLTELLWYTSWIALASVCYPYAEGGVFVRYKKEHAK
ncbi:MAG TPA: hypothetical protein VFI74_05515 [Candidatus Saccharimonadales bacterium]|nr:hypothetical protein [Candidatus Saccharimonadales bacterium]